MLIESPNPYTIPAKRLIDLERKWRKLSEQERDSYFNSFAKFREAQDGTK